MVDGECTGRVEQETSANYGVDLIYDSVEVIAERFRKAEKMEKMLAQVGPGSGLDVETKKST